MTDSIYDGPEPKLVVVLGDGHFSFAIDLSDYSDVDALDDAAIAKINLMSAACSLVTNHKDEFVEIIQKAAEVPGTADDPIRAMLEDTGPIH